MIYMSIMKEAGDNVGFEATLKILLENGFIEKDLILLSNVMQSIQRYDVIEKLKEYNNFMAGMEDGEFESKFKRELGTQAKEMKQWEFKLKQFIRINTIK